MVIRNQNQRKLSKRRRPRSNDDRKKDKNGYYFDSVNSKKTASRGVSEKNMKDTADPDVLKRRTIVDKFVNNAHMLMDNTAKIDSRNIYGSNNQKHKKNWNSASLNTKQFLKKKDMGIF